MNMMYFWLMIVIFAVVIEIATINFGTISIAIGGVGALIVESLGIGIVWQIMIFILLTTLSLIFLRPLALKLFDSKEDTRLNADSVIGKVAIVTETIKKNYPGAVRVQGKEWTAITELNEVSFDPGQEVVVLEIQGVKLLVGLINEEV